jgi:hypothetical protein
MSQKRNRAKLKMAQNGRDYHILWLNEEFPMYWDEGYQAFPRYRKGFVNPNKQIYSYQVRMYKTWKHTRKKQWK